jgi:hypothetical protein
LANPTRFHQFYRTALRFPYFLNQRRKGTLIGEETWYRDCGRFTLPEVFAAVIRHNIGPKPGLAYWGDKSPGYTYWIREIHRAFPGARFVHIVRDPRDYALSVRQAWGRDLLRAVQQWKVGTRLIAQSVGEPGIRLHTIRFEDLLQAPESSLTQLSRFLDVDFVPRMLEIGRVESVGAAANQTGIVADNMNKFAEQLSPRQLIRVESICGAAMRQFGYEPRHVAGDEDVPAWRMAAIRFVDSWNVLRRNAQRRGWIYGFKHAVLFRLMRIGAGRNPQDSLR